MKYRNDIKKVKTIIFDYDGTIHNTIKIYYPAFKKAYEYLTVNNYVNEKSWSEEDVSYWLGYNSVDMWNEFMPYLDEKVKKYCSELIGKEMTKLIIEQHASVYDGAIETLKYLKDKGYELIFLSNCGVYYKEIHRKTFELENYFNKMIACEEFDFKSKDYIIKEIRKDLGEEIVIVGDRYHDIEAGNKNSLLTIGCSYGYGKREEIDSAHIIIDDIRDLKNIF